MLLRCCVVAFVRFVLFCFVLFCFVLFCFVCFFCFVLFCLFVCLCVCLCVCVFVCGGVCGGVCCGVLLWCCFVVVLFCCGVVLCCCVVLCCGVLWLWLWLFLCGPLRGLSMSTYPGNDFCKGALDDEELFVIEALNSRQPGGARKPRQNRGEPPLSPPPRHKHRHKLRHHGPQQHSLHLPVSVAKLNVRRLRRRTESEAPLLLARPNLSLHDHRASITAESTCGTNTTTEKSAASGLHAEPPGICFCTQRACDLETPQFSARLDQSTFSILIDSSAAPKLPSRRHHPNLHHRQRAGCVQIESRSREEREQEPGQSFTVLSDLSAHFASSSFLLTTQTLSEAKYAE